jgi:sugar/nucleoside kinase (ribokinase family)
LLIVGGVYVDVMNEVETYPQEDSACRCLTSTRRRGGNAGNSSVVLARLLGAHAPACRVSWVGVVPSKSNADSAFALGAFAAEAVDASLLEEVGGDGVGQPTAYITLARDSGSRTIVSTRNGCRELSPSHFRRALAQADAQARDGQHPPVSWCHLECREMPSILEMAREWRASTGARANGHSCTLSLEVEKPHLIVAELLPLFGLCNVIFLSSEFVQRNAATILALGGADPSAAAATIAAPTAPSAAAAAAPGASAGEEHLAHRCLQMLAAQSPACAALWIVGWGSTGAFALDARAGRCRPLFQPAFRPAAVVDSVGAGDTFIAATIYALAGGADAEAALRCACTVAGAKVGRNGFDGLEAEVTFWPDHAPTRPEQGLASNAAVPPPGWVKRATDASSNANGDEAR